MVDIRTALRAYMDERGFIHCKIAENAGMTNMAIWGVFHMRRKLTPASFARCATLWA